MEMMFMSWKMKESKRVFAELQDLFISPEPKKKHPKRSLGIWSKKNALDRVFLHLIHGLQ